MVNPTGKEKGALVVFNPSASSIRQSITVPIYYTGLTDQVTITSSQGQVFTKNLDRNYNLSLDVSIEAADWSVYFIE
jgi:hypothetical protein